MESAAIDGTSGPAECKEWQRHPAPSAVCRSFRLGDAGNKHFLSIGKLSRGLGAWRWALGNQGKERTAVRKGKKSASYNNQTSCIQMVSLLVYPINTTSGAVIPTNTKDSCQACPDWNARCRRGTAQVLQVTAVVGTTHHHLEYVTRCNMLGSLSVLFSSRNNRTARRLS